MKKFLFLAVMLQAAVLGALAQSFTYNYRGIDFKCKVSKDEVTILGFNHDASKVVIPATVTNPKTGKSYDVTSVDLFTEVAVYKTNMVAIEKGIKIIKEYCFYNFKHLQQVLIPASIENVGKKAFNSKYMPSFTMPSSISEEDLRKGLAIYPQAVKIDNDPLADLDLSDYTDDDMQHDVPNSPVAEVVQPTVADAVPGSSDIDTYIPTTNNKRENTFCIIIANEKYMQKDTPKVKFAAQDGKTFYTYCTKTLGLPRENVRMVTNAKYLEMKSLLEWMSKVSNIYGSDANFIVYYSGHGVPDEKGNCKLMPVDVSINDVSNGYSLNELYNTLGNLTTKSALMIIDACFSGNDRDDVCALDENHKGIVRNVKQESVKGNVVVMTAASNTETALVYNEKAHGLFSYYLMKKLQETKGNVTYGELFDYVNKEVKRKSTVAMDKTQTPSVTYSDKIAGSWKDIKF